MALCSGPERVFALVSAIVFGLTWLYFLQRILEEVASVQPESEQFVWKWWRLEPTPRGVPRMWDDHVRLFPGSRKRLYCGLALSLFFLVPAGTMAYCLLR